MYTVISKIQPYITTIGLLLLTFYIGKSCNETPVPDTSNTESYTDTNWVNLEREIKIPRDSIVLRDSIVYDSIPFEIDTPAIIQDYFTKKYITTTAGNDTLSIEISDTLYRNRISYRSVNWNLNVPIIKDSTYTEVVKYRNGLYVGGQVGILGENPTLVPTVHFINKNRSSYSIGYDLLQRSIVIGYYYRLF